MQELRLTYHGTVYSKKNSKRIIRNVRTGRMSLVSSERARENEQAMVEQFAAQSGEPIRGTCVVDITIFEPNGTRRDLDNQATSVLDALKLAGVIVDDDFKNVTEMRVKFGGVDKNDPRVEVIIKEGALGFTSKKKGGENGERLQQG